MQAASGRQASLEAAAKEVLEDPVHDRIGAPFSALDCLRRTVGPRRNFLSQAFLPSLPAKATDEQNGNLRPSAADLAVNGNGVYHCVFPQPTATSPPAQGS